MYVCVVLSFVRLSPTDILVDLPILTLNQFSMLLRCCCCCCCCCLGMGGGGMGGMGMPPPEDEDDYGDDGHSSGPGGNMEF